METEIWREQDYRDKKQAEPEQGGARNEKDTMWGSGQRHVGPMAQSLSFAISTAGIIHYLCPTLPIPSPEIKEHWSY